MKYLPKNDQFCYRVLLIICCFVLMIFVSIHAVDTVFALELKAQAEDFIKQERFADLLDFLDILRLEKGKDITDLQIEYYSVLAKSKYLDYLEQQEDWKNYYNHVDIFSAEIIKSARDFVVRYPASLETIEIQYMAWKAIIRDEETASAEEAFSKLIDLVIAYTEKSGDSAVFREIASRLSDAGRVRQLNKLFNSYKEFLSTNAGSDSIERLGGIAEEYLQKERIETAIVIYEHYIDLVLRQYSQAKAQLVLNELADKFRHHGFSPAKDADFAEKIYRLIIQKFGQDALQEEDLFGRGYNLESLNIFDRAQEEYKYFVKKFPESIYLPEVYTRIAVINLYSLGRFGIALQFFQKVSEEFPDSAYAEFCTYKAAILLQWKSEDAQASRLYSILTASGGLFSEPSKARLNEIKNKDKLDERERNILEHLSGSEESSTIMMTLESMPQRSFVGEPVIWSATAQDFSSGTVQPFFAYEWFGDTGINEDPGNIPEFSTSYDNALPQIACFSATVVQTQGLICKSLWVHELRVKTPNNIMSFRTGEPVELIAEVFPNSIEDKGVLWQWKIGAEADRVTGNKFLHSYDAPGHYEIELVADVQGTRIFKKLNVEIVE